MLYESIYIFSFTSQDSDSLLFTICFRISLHLTYMHLLQTSQDAFKLWNFMKWTYLLAILSVLRESESN